MNPLLTVAVPVYNGERYIEKTIECILKSEYQELELLLIDDGSTDESGKICRKWQDKDKRIRYIRTENQGIVKARNRGVEQAEGEYICFCDQDDYVEPFMYRKVLEKMLLESAQIGMCSTGKMTDGQKSIYEKLEDGVYTHEEVLEYLLYPLLFRGYRYPYVRDNNYLYGTIWKCIFHKKFLTERGISFRSFVNYEDDWLFVTQALTESDKVVTIGETGYYWTVIRDSKSHKEQFIPDMMQRYEEMDKFVLEYLTRRIKNTEILEEYEKIAVCEHYAEGYKNELYSGKNRKNYRENLKEFLLKTDYREKLTCTKNLKSSAFRRKILYTSLRCAGIKRTFLTNRMLVWLEENAGKIKWVTALERKAKIKHRQEAV